MEGKKLKRNIKIKRRYSNADEVTGQLNTDFNDWCSILTTHSLQTAYAIIGANWAVHGSASNIINNYFSRVSILIIFIFLGLNLFIDRWMTQLHYKRFLYAEEDIKRWHKEYEFSKDDRYWPYTKKIEYLGIILRSLKTWAPILSAMYFILSLYYG